MDTGSAAQAINPTAPTAPTRFANLSDGDLADEIGDIDLALAQLDRRRDEARREMAHRDAFSLKGDRFVVVRSTGTALRFDTAAVKVEMGQGWYDARRKSVTSTTFKVMPRPAGLTSPAEARAAAEALFRR